MRKLSYEEVYEVFKDNGYELLDKEYINSTTKMTCVDCDGYKYFVKLNNIKPNLSKFCNKNPYTDFNIDNLLMISGNKYIRLTKDIESTKQHIDLIDHEGYKYRVSVSHIICKNKDSKLIAVGNNNYWSIYNINVYLKSIGSTDILKVDEFINQNEPLVWICSNGHEFHTNWNNYYTKGFRCLACENERRLLTFEECYNQVKHKYKQEYELLNMARERNESGKSIIRYNLRHNCGNEYWVNKNVFDSGYGCAICGHKKSAVSRRYDDFDIKKSVEDAGFEYLGSEYVAYKDKQRRYINIRHLKCGKENKMALSSWTRGSRCTCLISDSKKISYDEWERRTKNHPNGNFELLDVFYKNRNDGKGEAWLKIKCLDCNKIIERLGAGWDNGCPQCLVSKGEEKIKKFLEHHNVDFIPQKKYKGLVGVGGRKLSYDFYIPSHNLLIEYQGEFHDGTDRIIDKSYLPTQQEHDIRKREYAKDNNINLLEIWYWDYGNIETILSQHIS